MGGALIKDEGGGEDKRMVSIGEEENLHLRASSCTWRRGASCPNGYAK